jgi:hypothetical protein
MLKTFLHKSLQVMTLTVLFAAAPTTICAQETPETTQSTPETTQITPEAAQNTAQPTSNLEAALPSAVPTLPANKTDSQCYESFTYANALLRAENAYVRRKYTTVIEILKPIFENLQCIDDPNVIIEIELLLGVSYLEQNNAALADTFFLNVLRSEPDHVVGSVITLPESSARYIEDLRTQHAEELDLLRSERSPNTIIESLYIVTEKEQHPYWINFLPFGAGVFQMHETAWGAIYASLQLTGITLSILGGGMVEYYRGENFTYTPQNAVYAHNWQTAQIIGISMLAAGYVASVIHALIIHEDSTMIIHSPTQTRPDIAHNAGPFILPDGGGIAYSTKF